MVKKLFAIAIITALLLFGTSSVLASVHTTKNTDGNADRIYVAGNHDCFPIEYYDKEAEAFCGVMPDLLEEISERIDVNFVYINGGGKTPTDLAQNLQAEVISSCSDEDYVKIKDYIKMFSYKGTDGIKDICFLFTEISDDTFIENFKTAASQISRETIDGLIIKHSGKPVDFSYMWIFAVIFLIIILAFMIVLFVVKISKIKKKNRADMLTDAETGIGNLSYFKYRFENTIDDFSRSLFYVAYIVFDSSYLRSYRGSSMFSDCLNFTAETLSDHTNENEFSARITENGFTFVYTAINEEDAKKRLNEILKKLNEYVDISERSNKLVFHAALYNLNQGDKNSEILLFNLRKNCNKIFGTDKQLIMCNVHSMNKVQEEKKITENIIKGFEEGEFRLYLQFIVDAKTKKIVSAESLSRWDNKEKGLLSPGKYIDIMERSGLITKHDFNMFEMVVQQLAEWKNTKFSHITISCNFTRITLSEAGFMEKIEEICKKYDFDKTKVCIEITEDAIEKNMENVLNNIAKCKKLGFLIALDDLGSGYTSLENLCDYPIDIAKIDRDILLKTDSEKGKSLFEGIVELSHKLKLRVVCEGVETKEQDTFAQNSKVDYIQGFFHYKPMPKEECEKIL